jgi:hypothetical protein
VSPIGILHHPSDHQLIVCTDGIPLQRHPIPAVDGWVEFVERSFDVIKAADVIAGRVLERQNRVSFRNEAALG